MTALYQFKNCKDCAEPLWWDNNIRSQKTGGKIPLNSDGTKHFTTCEAREDQQQQQQEEQALAKEAIPGLTKDAPFQGANSISEAQQVVNRQIFARLDRIDGGITQIAKFIEAVHQYLKSDERMAEAETRYDQDKEDGLV